MALKENIEAIKKEIGAQEQFLEGIIKSERFFKKYKIHTIIVVTILIALIVFYAVTSIVNSRNIQTSNSAYNALIDNPKSVKYKQILKETNERLYNFYIFQEALKSDNKVNLKKLSKYQNDPIISDLATYQLSSSSDDAIVQSELLFGFITLQQGYKLLKENKIKEAKLKFAQIDSNSPLKNLAKT